MFKVQCEEAPRTRPSVRPWSSSHWAPMSPVSGKVQGACQIFRKELGIPYDPPVGAN